MAQYPAGAGPTAGSFAGQVWQPPAAAVDSGATSPDQIIRPQVLTTHAGADRVARFTPPPGVAWLVRRITVQADSTSRAYVYIGQPQPENLVCGTRAGTLDENDANQPYFVPEGSVMCVAWTNGTPTPAACVARIEYVEA